MAINISGSFVDDTTPMTGNIDGIPHFGIQGHPGPQGAPGGYYVPAIEQTGENELEVSFSPSLPDMPYVAPVKVTVTPDPDSGGNVELDTTLTQSGKAADAKAVGDALEKKLSADKLSEAVNDALAQAKASGEFDGDKGEQGIQGEPGADGKNGEDGKTPVKGVDYWTSEDKAEIVEDVLAEMPDVPGSGSALPPVTAEDNGAFLRVVDGAWAVATIPSAEGVSF